MKTLTLLVLLFTTALTYGQSVAISQLPAITDSLKQADMMPMVHNGTTRKVTMQQLQTQITGQPVTTVNKLTTGDTAKFGGAVILQSIPNLTSRHLSGLAVNNTGAVSYSAVSSDSGKVYTTDTTNLVGIGTAYPDARLNVAGSTDLNYNNGALRLIMGNWYGSDTTMAIIGANGLLMYIINRKLNNEFYFTTGHGGASFKLQDSANIGSNTFVFIHSEDSIKIDASNKVIVDADTILLKTSAGLPLIGIGTHNPTATVQLGDSLQSASLRYVDGHQHYGYSMISDAYGDASWSVNTPALDSAHIALLTPSVGQTFYCTNCTGNLPNQFTGGLVSWTGLLWRRNF